MEIQTSTASLKEQWKQLREEKPSMRIREAAAQIGVSEAELLATTVGEHTIRLEGDWTALYRRLPELGRVMSLTRNSGCVLEHKGTFEQIDIMGTMPKAMATVIGYIETRVFFSAWKFGFATEQPTAKGKSLKSLQFFDGVGEAITKIYLQEEGNLDAFEKLVEDFSAKEQDAPLCLEPPTDFSYKPIEQINSRAFIEAWDSLQDTHDFFGMLRKFEVHRQDALRLAEGKYTYRIAPTAIQPLLETVSTKQLPIMIFVGNRGNIQIHQGTVRTIRLIESPQAIWLNVLDPDFNMHLRQDLIKESWVVRKPTTDGIVTSLELFDKERNMIAQFFGLRKPSQPELAEWKNLIEEISQLKG
ncbi:MAG: hemin-degrading factor [Thermoflexibacter sp.]